jgi:CheY-like chemotaxis protein
VQAENGAVALRQLEAMGNAPCLVLIDAMMPEMTGPELIKVLRDAHRLATLPVVPISASILTPADCAGTCRFVKKPASLDVLLAITKEFCGPAR